MYNHHKLLCSALDDVRGNTDRTLFLTLSVKSIGMTARRIVTVLSKEQQLALRQYQYRGEDRSITYRYVLAPFYTWVVNYVPLWIAPNTLTLVGFLFPTIAHLLLIYHAPTLEHDAPRGVYLFSALSMLLYMVLDNLDGKQARRTNSSSALGYLFDHGCDALNVTVSGITLLACVMLWPPVLSVIVMHSLGHTMFYGAALEEFYTKRMILRELNGPNEGLLTLFIVQLLTAMYGPSFWDSSIHSVLPSNKSLAFALSLPPTVHALTANTLSIVHQLRTTRKQSAKSATLVTLAGFVPAMVSFIVQVCTAVLAPDLFQRFIVALLWSAGLFTFDSVTRMMMANLFAAPFPGMSPLMKPMLGCHAVVVVAAFLPHFVTLDIVRSVIWTCLATSFAYCCYRIWTVISQFCHALNIRCFSLKPLNEAEADVDS